MATPSWRRRAAALGLVVAMGGAGSLLVAGSREHDAHGTIEPALTTAKPVPPASDDRRRDYGVISGLAWLNGKPPLMPVPRKRRDAEACRDKAIPLDVVVTKDRKLRDVFVRIAPGQITTVTRVPSAPVVLRQVDCSYAPRIQGAVVGQDLIVENVDATLHNVHPYRDGDTWFNQAQPRGAESIKKELGHPAVLKFACDVHPWMRAFVVVSEHPYFAVTNDAGRFVIPAVPRGRYVVEAFHPRYGWKRREGVDVGAATAEVDFEYETRDPEPEENRGEPLE